MSTNKQPANGNNKSCKAAGIVAGILFIAVIIFLLLHSCGSPKSNAQLLDENSGIHYDGSAVEGGWDEVDTDKILESLNRKVEEGMINISMNTSPIFETAASEGSLMIVNESINRYPQVVEITRNDTDELIYKSGAIPVGSKIEKAKLTVELDPGTYECTALFYNVDPDTGSYLGCAGALINITIKGEN